MLTIATVLKTGKFKNGSKRIEYTPNQVLWLKKQIETHVTIPHDFVCLTDINIPGCKTIPVIHDWPGWWSKMELFRPQLFNSHVFYVDLDTVILNNIDKMVQYNKTKYFIVLRNLFKLDGFGSGIMAWRGDFSQLYEIFKSDSDNYMRLYSKNIYHWGDQAFLQDHIKGAVYFQDIFPNWIISFIFDMLKKRIKIPPKDGRIVCFQGKPKPWEIKANWIPRLR